MTGGFYGGQSTYGTNDLLPIRQSADAHLKPNAGHRRRTHLCAILLTFLAPLALFCGLFAAVSFSLHYNQASLLYTLEFCGFLAVVAIVYLAVNAVRRRWSDEKESEPAWYLFCAVGMFVAFVVAIVLGQMNYWNNTRPFNEINSLSCYPQVDPVTTVGTQVMDAGRIEFTNGSYVDNTKAMSFMNSEQYCVAPIVAGNETLSTYDLWAVGLNCCAVKFHCGDLDKYAHSGLRLVREDQQSFFVLAVQQAQATFNLNVRQPVFFYWVNDSLGDLETYKDDSVRFYVSGCLVFLAFQVAALVLASMVFRKFGLD